MITRSGPTLKELWESGCSIAQMEKRLGVDIMDQARYVPIAKLHAWFRSGAADRAVFGAGRNPNRCPTGTRMCFTTHRGKVYLTSERQHRFMHARHFDHTHVSGNRRVRERWVDGRMVRKVEG